MPARGITGSVVLSAAVAIAIVGCGGGGDSSGSTTTTEAEATGGGGAAVATAEIKMGDFFFEPDSATLKQGPTTIEAPNEGAVEHELVVFKTNMNPAKLPTEANGDVAEEKMDKIAESAGEIPDVEAGATKSAEFKLTPGTYVMFCNLPGHYAQGMYGTITVTK